MIEFKVDLDYKGHRVGVPVQLSQAEHDAAEDPVLDAMIEAQSILAESLSAGDINKYNDIMLTSNVVRVNLVKGGF